MRDRAQYRIVRLQLEQAARQLKFLEIGAYSDTYNVDKLTEILSTIRAAENRLNTTRN